MRALRRTPLAALFALLVMIGSVPVSISALVHEADDAACERLYVAHDESAHRVGAERSHDTRVPQHCALCHWLQSLQTLLATSSVPLPGSDIEHFVLPSVTPAGRHAVGEVPARAPPAVLNS